MSISASQAHVLARYIYNAPQIFGEQWMYGSPSYGVLKYMVPDWDLAMTKQYKNIYMTLPSSKIGDFGREFTLPYHFYHFEFEHPKCLVSLRVLHVFEMGPMAYYGSRGTKYVDQASSEDMNLVTVGDTSILEEMLTYLNIMASIDSSVQNPLKY